jgi:RimJ/RimL family protein N-acetyltransferase
MAGSIFEGEYFDQDFIIVKAQTAYWGQGDTVLRRLTYGDLPLIERHLLDLDMVSRNSRFHRSFGDSAVTAYVRNLDAAIDVLFGAIEPRTDCPVGLAEARPARIPRTVDLATSVLVSHRKRGLAHELLTRVIELTFDRGMTAAELVFQPGNLAASRIAARLGARFRAPGFAVVEVRPIVFSSASIDAVQMCEGKR